MPALAPTPRAPARPAARTPAKPEIPLGDYNFQRAPVDQKYIVAFVQTKRQTPDQLEAVAQDICAAYGRNDSMEELMHRYNATYQSIRTVLAKHGVEIRGPGRPKGKAWAGYDKIRKITAPQKAWALAEDLKGTSHRFIADKLGISRERVRQICREAGHAPRYGTAAKSPRVRRLASAVYADQTGAPVELVKQVSSMWLEGKTVPEIAKMIGQSPGGLGVRIHRWRQTWPALFPGRYTRHTAAAKEAIEVITNAVR